MTQELLYGVNTVLSLLKYNAGKRKIFEIIINQKKRKSPRFHEIITEASKKSIPVQELDAKSVLNILKNSADAVALNKVNIPGDQGVIARVSEYNYSDLDHDIENTLDENSILVILDGITDVGNFGSILRNCSAFGVSGVIVPKRRSVEANSRLSKISSGAYEEIKIYRVTNIVRTIEKLQKNRFWIFGTTLNKGNEIKDAAGIKYLFPLAIVFGSEERGMHDLVEKSCDFLIRIQMSGRMQSLNVATASGIFLYILRRFQKTNKTK